MSFTFKAVGLVLLIASGILIGLAFSSKLKRRCDFLRAFIDFLNVLETNIRYRGDEIITLISLSTPELLKDIFDGNGKVFSKYWQASISSIPRGFGLKSDDISLLREFGRALGTTDTEGQLNHIRLYKNLFENSLSKASDEYKAKGRLYKVLGLFSGVTTALILV